MRSNKVVAVAVGVLILLAAGLVSSLGADGGDPESGSLAVSVDDPVGVGDAEDEGDATGDASGDATGRAPPASDGDSSDVGEGGVDGSFDQEEGDRDGSFGPDNDEGGVDGDFSSVRYSDLPTISVFDLPSEAIDTLDLIEEGGPYPYRQDGGTFQNREGILPDRDRGFYEEFTVETPGSDDRGARRIVAGADGSRYWTDDHYDSFREIVFE